MWLYVLKFKGGCFEKFKEFKTLVKTQLEQKIKTSQSDNGGEFASKVYFPFLEGSWYREANVYIVYALTNWNGGACEMYHHGDGKEHASCLDPR